MSFVSYFHTLSLFVSILLVAFLLGFIPLFFSLHLYRKTHFSEYLVLTFFWLFSTITIILNMTQEIFSHSVLFWQLLESVSVWYLFFLILHSIKLKPLKSELGQKMITLAFLSYCLILQGLIFFWGQMEQTTSIQWFWMMNPYPLTQGSGAGIVLTNGNVLYSSGHFLFRDILSTIAFTIFFLIYWTIKPFHSTPRIKKALILWRVTTFSGIVMMFIVNWLWKFQDFNIHFIPAIAGVFTILIAIITVKYPEAFLISHSQIYVTLVLYRYSKERKKSNSIKKDDLEEYLFEVAKKLSN